MQFDLNTDNKWVSIYGTYNTFTHCLLKDKFNKGATLVVWLDGKTEAHHTISYNYFLNRQNGPNADNGLESLRIGTSETSFTPAHCVVAFNRFENVMEKLKSFLTSPGTILISIIHL
jgi:poly(beta-D-mannuronate) lyase